MYVKVDLLRKASLLGRILALLMGNFVALNVAAQVRLTCPIAVQSSVPASVIENLRANGFAPKPSDHLTFGFYSLRLHADRGDFVFDHSKNKIYFDFHDDTPRIPLLVFGFPQGETPKCQDLLERLDKYSERRALALPAIRHLRGEEVPFLDAIVGLEKLAFRRAGRTDGVDQEFLNYLRESARDAAIQGGTEFFKQLNEVRKSLLRGGLKNYCRDRATITDLTTVGCTNCVGNTTLLVGMLSELKLPVPSPWQPGVAIYSDHLQPVLWNAKTGQFLDMLGNDVSRNVDLPIVKANELLRMGLRLNADLVLPTDKLEIDSIEYLQKPNWSLKETLFWAKAAIDPDGVGGVRASSMRVDAFNYLGFNTKVRYGQGTPPERADMSGLLAAEYSGEIGGVVDKSKDPVGGRRGEVVRLHSSLFETAEFMDANLVDLLPEEKADWQRMRAQKASTAQDITKYSAALAFPGREIPNHALLPPFVLKVGVSSTSQSPLEFEYSGSQYILRSANIALMEELRKLPLRQRYTRMVEVIRDYWRSHIRKDLVTLTTLMAREDWILEVAREEENLTAIMGRIGSATHFHGPTLIGVSTQLTHLVDVIPGEIAPDILRLLQTLDRQYLRMALHHEKTMELLGSLEPNQKEWLVMVGRLRVLKYVVEKLKLKAPVFGAERLTEGLMLALLHDQRHIWRAPKTAGESVDEALSEVDRAPPSILDLAPKIELPKMGKCNPGDRGWMQSGSFVWKCSETAKSVPIQIQDRVFEGRLREVKEVRADILVELIQLNAGLFLSRGNLVMLHEMWNEALERAYDQAELDNIVGADPERILDHQYLQLNLISVLRLAPTLLSPNLPTQSGSQAWLENHPNYPLAYRRYLQNPKKAFAKTQPPQFESKDSLAGSLLPTQLGGFNSSIRIASDSPIFHIRHSPAWTVYRQNIGVRERTGWILLDVHLEGANVRAAPASNPGFKFRSREIPLADGSIRVYDIWE